MSHKFQYTKMTDPILATNMSWWGHFLHTTWYGMQIGTNLQDDRAGRDGDGVAQYLMMSL